MPVSLWAVEAVASCFTRQLTCHTGRSFTAPHTCVSVHALCPLQESVTRKTFGWLTPFPFSPPLGLDAELYYVRNDLISHYALSFNLLVPSETNFLHFTWHAKSKVSAAGRPRDRSPSLQRRGLSLRMGLPLHRRVSGGIEHWVFSGV